ncbi:MAG TPA: DUF1858 domain-containing protein [Anaerolineae bacterium]|nr:DUF1858 domain-containing protein [Anaerolineae bacterium]
MRGATLDRASVQELLDEYPETIPIFLKYRMACVGCDLNRFHTLADVIAIYNLDGARFLDEIQAIFMGDSSQNKVMKEMP